MPEKTITLSRNVRWRYVTFPAGSQWPARVWDDGRTAISWRGNRVPLRDADLSPDRNPVDKFDGLTGSR